MDRSSDDSSSLSSCDLTHACSLSTFEESQFSGSEIGHREQ